MYRPKEMTLKKLNPSGLACAAGWVSFSDRILLCFCKKLRDFVENAGDLRKETGYNRYMLNRKKGNHGIFGGETT
ncbi:hypothetical protein D1970_06285 [Mesobacillus zeae]|uniref:Uncharacterized protein n=1 Tax=Mesobacillus zeae TaxID=1917180 RepID=A0A398BH27_9BACI|nr:hypothetical protein D1970_06285 [Mesobacillus zeae]